MVIKDGIQETIETADGKEIPFICPQCGNTRYMAVARRMEGKSFYSFQHYKCLSCDTRFNDALAFMNGNDDYKG